MDNCQSFSQTSGVAGQSIALNRESPRTGAFFVQCRIWPEQTERTVKLFALLLWSLQMNTFTATFFQLHQATKPLLLVNVWDPVSALLAQQQGAQALGTSSAALAWSLGYADGEQLPRDELLAAVRRLLRVCQVPLTVDLELGYSNEPDTVALLVQQLAELGVAGINLEDGLTTPQLLCQKIAACRVLLQDMPFFINVRTDVWLRGFADSDEHALRMCVQRFEWYQEAGANGAFVPGLTSLALARQLSEQIRLPLNLMGWPAGATLADLATAGISRLSAGPALFLASANALQQVIAEYLQQPAPAKTLDVASMELLCQRPVG